MRERVPISVSGGPGFEAPNRLFIIIAIGLVGMLVLGLLGIGGYVVFSRARQAMVPTPTVMVKPPETPTRTSTPTYTLTFTPTKTPTRAPSYTPVVLPPTSTPVEGAVTPSAIEVAVTPTPTSGVGPPPDTGFGIGALGVGMVLAALLILARRVRLAS